MKLWHWKFNRLLYWEIDRWPHGAGLILLPPEGAECCSVGTLFCNFTSAFNIGLLWVKVNVFWISFKGKLSKSVFFFIFFQTLL